jgi:hypothetical protein
VIDTVEKLVTVITACEQEELDKVRLRWHDDVFACPACEAPIVTRHHSHEDDRTWVGPCECVLTPEQIDELCTWVSDTNPNVVRHCESLRALVQLCWGMIDFDEGYKLSTDFGARAWSAGRVDVAISTLRLLAGAYDVPYETDPDQFERMKASLGYAKRGDDRS